MTRVSAGPDREVEMPLTLSSTLRPYVDGLLSRLRSRLVRLVFPAAWLMAERDPLGPAWALRRLLRRPPRRLRERILRRALDWASRRYPLLWETGVGGLAQFLWHNGRREEAKAIIAGALPLLSHSVLL